MELNEENKQKKGIRTDSNTNRTNSELPRESFILAEYNAICEKLKTLPNFRFALIALYVGAVGVIAFSDNPDKLNFYGMIGLTLLLWIIDLRTRGLIDHIRERGVKIEEDYWSYKGEKAKGPYITRLEEKKFSKAKIFNKIPVPVSHSLGIDLLFAGVIVYSIIRILKLNC